METVRVLIVEDKALIAESIKALLHKHNLETVAMCTSGEDALEVFRRHKPDIILMDIELDGALDGIATAKLIHEEWSGPIIYLTDFADQRTVDRAKKTGPINYLTKPFNEVELIRAIDIAVAHAALHPVDKRERANRPLMIRTDSQEYKKLDPDEIIFLKAARAYCEVVTDQGTLLMSSSMNQIFEQLRGTDFLQVHRSYCVNIRRIKSLQGNTLTVAGDNKIPVSKEHKDNLLSHLKIIR